MPFVDNEWIQDDRTSTGLAFSLNQAIPDCDAGVVAIVPQTAGIPSEH
jgi:hypothetical protein